MSNIKSEEWARLMGRHWAILEKLYKKEYYVSELATELGKKMPGVSAALKELKIAKLVEKLEPKKGERREYHVLTDNCKKQFEAINSATAAEAEKPKINLRRVDRYLDIAEDRGLSEKVRYTYANRFFDVLNQYPVLIFTKNQRMRRFFERMITEPYLNERVGERLRASLRVSIERLMGDKSTSAWVRNELYPQMVKTAGKENLPEGIQVWILWMLEHMSGVAVDLRKDTMDMFLKMYWDKSLDPKSERAGVLRRALSSLFSFDSESGKKAFLGGYLFSLPLKLEQELQKKRVSKKLMGIFKEHGHILSGQAQIRPINGKGWRILDGKKEYTAKEDNKRLNIYLVGVIEMAKSSDQLVQEKAESLLEACD